MNDEAIKKIIRCVIEPILRKRYPISPPMLGNDEDHMEITPWNMKMLGAMVMKTY